MENNYVRRLSCKRCQHRKIRCSRTHPCGNCSAANARCEFRDNDFKRPPVSREYATALESRVAMLEGVLARLKNATHEERNTILGDVIFHDHMVSFESPLTNQEEDLSGSMAKASMQETTEGSMIYHGPTSIFTGVEENPGVINTPTTTSLSYESVEYYHNPMIRLCLALFFYWQYSQFMFIDRECFVQEFDRDPINSEFCSPSLIYAASALGALMSHDADTRALASKFVGYAEDILVRQGLVVPTITSVQALLCCAYYEVGKGNLSKGWMYSGMAFRMGQDLGLQRDPALWGRPAQSTAVYFFDEEFRRRIYWGCFLSDKIFSLFLGRPTFMHENDADVDTSEPLPHDPPIWDDWLQSHNMSSLKTVRPAGPKLTLLFNQQVDLGRIIHDILSNVFSPKGKGFTKSKRWTTTVLQQLNARLLSWHEALPADMRWKKWFTNRDRLQPNVTVLQ
ncbi:fungal-specific transcription factor domain-containing protein [Daldinia grandis]|nr:fungal-specific transcription factor domain-containing protein [Daldinia grandis]